jgi:hypothetical protein
MALLPAGGRVELNLPWINTTVPNNAYNETQFGVYPGTKQFFPTQSALGFPFTFTEGEQYQGLLYVNPDHWAFQAVGQFTDYQVSDQGSEDTEAGGELVRIAKDWGPLTLGTEVRFSQSNTNEQGSTGTNQQTGSFIGCNSGLLANFQLADPDHPLWLRLGGSFSFEISASQLSVSQNDQNPGTETIAQTLPLTLFEPCIFVEVPGNFQAGLLLSFQNETDSSSFTNSGRPQFDQPSAPSDNINSENIVVLYKYKMALADPGNPHPFSLNQGALFEVTSSTVSYLDPPNGGYLTTTYTLQVGAGLEWEKDLTLGFQADWNEYLGNPLGPNQAAAQNNNNYQFALGGEKWLTEHWAFRAGLLYGNDQFGPAFQASTIIGLTGTAGIGYEQKGFRVDGLVWFEQPTATGIPDYINDILGLDLDAAVLF